MAIGTLVPFILAVFKIKYIPIFVVEIIIGMMLGSFGPTKEFFTSPLLDGLYMIGIAFMLFLSGLDTDFSVWGRKKMAGDGKNINPFRLSIGLIASCFLLSLLASLCFIDEISSADKASGILLVAICFFGTFASSVIPLVKTQNAGNATIGKIVNTYSTISELLSILTISALLIVNDVEHNQKPWILFIVIALLIVVFLIVKYFSTNYFRKIMDGIVHFGLRICILILLLLTFLTGYSGAEFILGAFLAGMVMKAARISESTLKKIEVVAYGIFVPMFYILVGVQIPLLQMVRSFEQIKLILVIFGIIIAVKIPFLILFKWYYTKTVVLSLAVVTCTIIVSIAASRTGILKKEFCDALIVASSLTCLIPPIIFQFCKNFGVCRPKYRDVIIEPHEIEEE